MNEEMSESGAILITGAARGIGRAMALHLARPGALLLLHYRNSREEAESLVREVEADGARAETVQADLALTDERTRMMERVAAMTPTLNVLVNNVGVYDGRELPDITPESWQQVFDTTCSAVFHIIRCAVPLLRAGAPARIVNMGDSGSDRITARTTATPYHIAKLGVAVLTRSYAKLLAGDGITVNQISPGFLENSVGDPGSPLPAGRKGKFEDILPALDYLLSPEAAYVTGANIAVTGGWNI